MRTPGTVAVVDRTQTQRAPLVPGYDVLGRLGQGASAAVWRARRHADGLVVALKVLARPDGDVGAALREAGLLAAVRHPHVVRLYDVLPLPDPETGRPAAVVLATQLAGGGSLAQVLARRRRLSAGELVTALQPVAGALADLHGQGVVHGDLSTGNVLFTGDGMPLVSDLGAARVAGSVHAAQVGTGADSGLVAPEVVEGFPATRESDVYQLGAVAWLCLVGDPPGPVWSRGELDELAPGLPGGLPDLVTRCLAPEPGDRPDAEEVALALLAATTPEPVEVAPDADPGQGLTERLRRQARDDLAGEEPPGPQGGTRARLLHPLRRRAGARPARGSHREVPAEAARPGLRVAAWSAVAVLLLVAAVGAGRLLGVDRPALPGVASAADGASAGDGGTSGDSASAGAGSVAVPGEAAAPSASAAERPDPASSVEGAPAEDASAEAAAETADVVGTVQALVDGRALAWEEGDPALLEDVTASGSPALRTESDALDEARGQGVTYEEVSFVVEEAVVVTEGDDRLTVDAAVTRAPLRGTDADGEMVVTEPETTEQVRLVLARDDGGDDGDDGDDTGWLLWSWAPKGEKSPG